MTPVVVHVAPPGSDVTVELTIAAPPSETGAVHRTVACPDPGTAETPCGADGTVAVALGVTHAVADDDADHPTLLCAVTVNRYSVPLTRPVTSHVVASVVVHVAPPGSAVTA